MIDVVILEDHKMFSITFSSYLRETGRFQKITAFENVPGFFEFIGQKSNDDLIIILDYFLPDIDFDSVINQVRTTVSSCKIIVLTGLTSVILLKRLLFYDLAGIISKVDSPLEVLICLNNFKKGKTYLSVTVRDIFSRSLENPMKVDLTKKETEVLKLLSEGKTVEDISKELYLSKHTVVTHRRNILAKSDFHSISDLIIYMLKNGMI